MPELILPILSGIATLWLTSKALKFLAALWRIFYPYVFARPKNLEKLAGKGSWALVTGCTDGIGRAYAEQLAQRGFNLILVSRTQQKLSQMEAELRRRYAKSDFRIIPFDLSETSLEEYQQRLFKTVENLDIGILVNNVGDMHAYPQRFHDSEGGLEKIAQILKINLFPVTLLSAQILKQMVRRGKGVIVNISSEIAYSPCYYSAIYSATKIYVNWLTAALRKEYAPQKGIIIQTICPSVVITKMSGMVSEGKKPNMFMPSAENFAKSAIQTLGNVSETSGCLGHQIQHEFIYGLFPKCIREWAMKKMILKIRNDYLKRRESQEKLFDKRMAQIGI